MGLNDTPSGERLHIGFFGRRNSGKSSLVNAVTGQEMSLVSDTLGTTTDPVSKAMELLPLGPVMIIDTPGFDDVGALGEQRVRRTRQILNRADIAVLVIDATVGLLDCDRQLIGLFREKKIPYIIAANKCDLLEEPAWTAQKDGHKAEQKSDQQGRAEADEAWVFVSALRGTNIHALKERIAALTGGEKEEKHLVGDLLRPGDQVVLVIPIDGSAPKGRLILPQQQTIRDVLEAGASAVCVKDTELGETLARLGRKPELVITDSQVFGRVSKIVPDDVTLTSFSILMARYKGFLDYAVRGVAHIDGLKDGDRILVAEGCTHHRQCEDIGTVKLPKWLCGYTGKKLVFETSSGRGFPEDLSDYAMVLHCGGCMLTERELLYRMKCAEDQGVPVSNYGITIAHVHGILKRSLSLFPDLAALL